MKLHILYIQAFWLKLTGPKIYSLDTILNRLKQTNQTLQGRNTPIFEIILLLDFHLAGQMEKEEEVLEENQCLFVFYLLSKSMMPLKDSWVQAEFRSLSRMVYIEHFSRDKNLKFNRNTQDIPTYLGEKRRGHEIFPFTLPFFPC